MRWFTWIRLQQSLLLVGVFCLMAVAASAQDADSDSPILDRIQERGELICGVNQNLIGFGLRDDDAEGGFVGFDVDLCRAVAIAVLGDASAVQYLPLSGDERGPSFANDLIDMMSRNTTFTVSRDTEWAVIFGPTMFYDGQGVMTRAELGVFNIDELDGEAICVQSGTTTELNITDYVFSRDLNIEIQVYPTAARTWDAYISGRCNGWTTDKSGLASFRLQAENPDEHVILAETISKEPLGPLSSQRDQRFAEIIRWTMYGLIQAEEFGITSDNIASFLPAEGESDDAYISRVGPGVARFLGQANQESGSYLGVANDFMVDVVSTLGNYGQLYERHLSPLGLERERTLNDLWTNSGALYAPPFR